MINKKTPYPVFDVSADRGSGRVDKFVCSGLNEYLSEESGKHGYGVFSSYSALSSFFLGEPTLFRREMQHTIKSVTMKIASQPFNA